MNDKVTVDLSVENCSANALGCLCMLLLLNVCDVSDSGSYESSHSSVNRDSGSHHDHSERRASADQQLMSSECNGAGDADADGDADAGDADYVLGHLHDADAVSTEYELSVILLAILLIIVYTVPGSSISEPSS